MARKSLKKQPTDMSIIELLSTISEEEKYDMIRKNWLSHDARWQMQVVSHFGWEMGNKLNKAVSRDMGKVMMYRMMKTLGITQVKNMDELMRIEGAVVYLNFPNFYPGQIKSLSDLSVQLHIEKCNTYENVKKANAIDKFECACFEFRSGLFDALGIDVEQELQKCLIKGDNCCEIFFKVKKF